MNSMRTRLEIFDRFREMRNDIVYSSRYISEDEAEEALLFAVKFVEKIKVIPYCLKHSVVFLKESA
jgi:hypothetical protein